MLYTKNGRIYNEPLSPELYGWNVTGSSFQGLALRHMATRMHAFGELAYDLCDQMAKYAESSDSSAEGPEPELDPVPS